MDRSGEVSRDMVTLRKRTCSEWMCNATTDGRCADWACVDPEPKVTSGQLVGGDCDEDAVNLEQKVFFGSNGRGRRHWTSTGGYRGH